ncbi:MAG: hypothetical protein J6X60_10000, partial [Ruminiclostridium sp.]|nr:hypothetical protein [Ruminiclostridium sp.]
MTDYTLVTSSDSAVEWTAGTSVVADDVTINGKVTLKGDTNLILCDGASLTIGGDGFDTLCIRGNYTLSIYGQTNQTGKLTATTTSNAVVTKNLNIYGGDITVAGNNGFAINDYTNIYGGTVNAAASYSGGIAIRGGLGLTIIGGNVTAANTAGGCALFSINNISLGWTDPDDSISITGSVAVGESTGVIEIAGGQYLTDGNGGLYSGTFPLTENGYYYYANDLANKTLVPAYKVTFTADDIDDIYMGADRTGNDKVTAPEVPMNANNEIVLWYADDTFATPADFSQPITSDTTFYGKWTP